MRHQLAWTHTSTATVSFALGWALTLKWNPSQDHSVTGTQSANFKTSISTSSQADASEETTVRTRVAKRDETKKPSEPSVSLPLTTIAGMIREKSKGDFDFQKLQDGMKNSLTLFGATERETNDIHKLLKDISSEISAEGIKLIKPIQVNESEIHLDNRAMEPFSKTIAPKIQEGIRASLSADLADVLISSTQWDKLYPTGEKSFPVLTITRQPNGKIFASFRQPRSSMSVSIDSKFLDDGTPIPVDELFSGWFPKPFLKGFTLLPKDDK